MARVDIGLLFTARDRLTAPLRRLGAQFDKTQRKAVKLKASIKSIDLVIGAIILRKIIGVTSAFVKMGAEMEALRFRLGVFERSAEGADRVFKKLLSTFRDVPFDLKTIGDAFVRLRSAGIDPLDGSLKAIIDGVAAFGGGSQELQRTVIGIQQMAGKGVVSMEEMRQQIGEAMPFAMRVMADSMDISVTKLISQIERGELGAREGIAALVKGLQGTVGGVAEGMVNTMGGAFEQLVKVVQESAAKIFTEFRVGDVIVLMLRELTSEIQEFVAGLDPQKVRDFVFGLKDIFITGVKVVKWLAEFAGAAGKMISSIVSYLGADASMLLAAGFIGLLMFGPPGALIAMAVVAGVGIVREVDKMNKAISEPHAASGGRGGRLRRKIVEEGKASVEAIQETSKALTEASAEQNAQLEEIRKAKEETFKQIGTISSGAGLSVQSQKQVRFLETSIKSLKAKLEGTGPLPFLQQMKKFTQVANAAAEAFERDRKTITLLQADLAKFREKGDVAGVAQAEKDLKRAMAELTDARDLVKEQEGWAALWFSAKLDTTTKKVSNKLISITNDLNKRASKLMGDLFGDAQARASINKDYDETHKKLIKELELATAVSEQDASRSGNIALINAELERANALRAQELQRTTEITAARKSLFAIEQRNAMAQGTRDLGADLRALEAMANPIKAAFTPEIVSEARQMKEEIQGQVEALELRVATIREAGAVEGGLNDSQREQISLLNERIGVLGQLKAATSETALLAKELWSSVATTLKQGLGEALLSVVDGHKSAKDIINDMFRSITKAAADYIAQLIIMKALSSGMGGGMGGMGGMGGLFGGMFAKGGMFKGGIKAFANGDIIKGPTMFGLAGEAGTEAIMPLERVGGKLGVRAAGGGEGDTLNLTVQAIDQQSGADFLLNNLHTIQGGMQNQKALNGTGR